MAGITLAQAEAQLSAWLAASLAVSSGQSYSIASGTGNRTLTRANAAEIRENITFWDNHVKRLTRGGIRVRGATPSF